MKRFARAIVSLVALAAAVPALAFVLYYAIAFLPKQDDVHAFLDRADPQDRNPPASIHTYVSAMHQEGAPSSSVVSRQLVRRLLPRSSNTRRHVREIMWSLLLPLHYSDQELMGLYSTLAYNGEGSGLNALALRLYAKPLDMLADQEAAAVVAYTWGPSLYEGRPELLHARRDKLLAAAGARPN